jgi:hypothetical protein
MLFIIFHLHFWHLPLVSAVTGQARPPPLHVYVAAASRCTVRRQKPLQPSQDSTR